MNSFLSHLECSDCSSTYSADEIHGVCRRCGKSLFVRYQLDRLIESLPKSSLSTRPHSMWRYRELLPVVEDQNVVSLGEGFTPILRFRKIGEGLGLENLYLKDESQIPTGSFKARGLAVAISKAKELGITKIVLPTAGNAGSAAAAYAARANIEAHVFAPKETPEANQKEIVAYGAQLHLVDGLISDAGRLVGEVKEKNGWFDVSTLKEPFRVEGKKTMGFELAEQFDWTLPDAIVFPTGGGTGVIGMWKAFAELESLGWVSDKKPKIFVVQSSGCAPLVRAFEEQRDESTFWQSASTIASGLCVPKAFADRLVLRVLRESNGGAVAVTDEEIMRSVKEVAQKEGILVCPEGGATLAALKHLKDKRLISEEETVVLFNTGSALKYMHLFGL